MIDQCVLALQIKVAAVDLGKSFEVLSLIPEGTQRWGTGDWNQMTPVCEGPALRTADGQVHCKPAGGRFPPQVAVQAAQTRVQDACASREKDLISIRREMAGMGEEGVPPEECAGYELVNQAVQRLYRGAALYSHSLNGALEQVESMLVESCDGIDYQTSAHGLSVLYGAVSHGHSRVVELLLDYQADPNAASALGMTPVFLAAQDGREAVLELLLTHNADPNLASNEGVAAALSLKPLILALHL